MFDSRTQHFNTCFSWGMYTRGQRLKYIFSGFAYSQQIHTNSGWKRDICEICKHATYDI